eukprot:TRINITY_DN7384_c0_g1_i1.p1 TRINITY_DN7384_c0_g1~~TRINITY_DN7384_c0_g1_i1.p1  ORF type:complete len:110 (-),score=20.43 TRINITY_DN7384_c0_g1_i1:45-326(-)
MCIRDRYQRRVHGVICIDQCHDKVLQSRGGYNLSKLNPTPKNTWVLRFCSQIFVRVFSLSSETKGSLVFYIPFSLPSFTQNAFTLVVLSLIHI